MTTQDTMQAAVLVAEGDPDAALAVRTEPVPEPGERLVRVRLTHASLNHLDVWIRKGLPSVPKPRIMGADGAGRIDAAGSAAVAALSERGLATGDRVLLDPGIACGACGACVLGDTALCERFQVLGEHVAGTHAQFVVVPVENVHPVPQHLTDAQAAALTLAFATSWRMLFTRARVRAGERVLVWGASSGVGAAALQLCTAAGIPTLATTRSDDKVDVLRELGADDVIVLPGADERADAAALAERAASFSSGAGIDAVFDHLGRVAWEPSMRVLRKGGRYVTCGATTGAQPPANVTRLFWKQLSMLGSTMASRDDVREMLEFVAQHEIVPRIDATFPLTRIADAHRHLEASAQIGKVVLDVG